MLFTPCLSLLKLYLIWCLGIPMVVETDEGALRKFNGIIKLNIRLLGHGDMIMFIYLKF